MKYFPLIIMIGVPLVWYLWEVSISKWRRSGDTSFNQYCMWCKKGISENEAAVENLMHHFAHLKCEQAALNRNRQYLKYFNVFNIVLVVVLCSFVISYLLSNRSVSARNDLFNILIINAGYSVIIQGLRAHLKEWEERLKQSQAASAPIS